MARNYSKSAIADHLSEYGLTLKGFSEWCGMSESGLSRALKKECVEGFSNLWHWAVMGFICDSGKGGFRIEHDIFRE
jgi:hypothetical protein